MFGCHSDFAPGYLDVKSLLTINLKSQCKPFWVDDCVSYFEKSDLKWQKLQKYKKIKWSSFWSSHLMKSSHFIKFNLMKQTKFQQKYKIRMSYSPILCVILVLSCSFFQKHFFIGLTNLSLAYTKLKHNTITKV